MAICNEESSSSAEDAETTPNALQTVEDYRPGYPRFAALIGSHPSFHVFRRFASLRARLLLYKQDQLSLLEKQLDKLDEAEHKPLFLASIRRDKNESRKKLFGDLEVILKEYDALANENEKVLSRAPAKSRDISNLQNWVDNTACIARDEVSYLSRGGEDGDLMALGALGGDITEDIIKGHVSDAIIIASKLFRKKRTGSPSSDPNVHILPTSLTMSLTRSLLAAIFLLILFIPVILITFLDSTAARLSITLMACAVFIAVLSVVAKVKTGELFVAGATYAAVLVVFIAGNGISS